MNLEEIINTFNRLGKFLKQTSDLEFAQKIKEAEVQNPWFTLENQKQAINAWVNHGKWKISNSAIKFNIYKICHTTKKQTYGSNT